MPHAVPRRGDSFRLKIADLEEVPVLHLDLYLAGFPLKLRRIEAEGLRPGQANLVRVAGANRRRGLRSGQCRHAKETLHPRKGADVVGDEKASKLNKRLSN